MEVYSWLHQWRTSDGSYWTVTSVDTKPGKFDDYLSDLNNVWRKSMDMLIADGKVYRQFLNPGEAPEAVFCIEAAQVSAREYCNLHGLWKA